MRDFAAALGLVFVLEGVVMLAAPGPLGRALARLSQAPPERLRMTGLWAAIAGVFLVWVVRRGLN
jgi:uncharacterized protein YjeT (DUF2065 family)